MKCSHMEAQPRIEACIKLWFQPLSAYKLCPRSYGRHVIPLLNIHKVVLCVYVFFLFRELRLLSYLVLMRYKIRISNFFY